MDFNIVRANIAKVSADAIVLPANPMLKEGSGASTAIFEAAGRKKLAQACEKLAPCEVGSAVPTLAFKLNAKYIVHAVVPKWIDGEHNEYELLSSAYLSALNIAEVMGCESIAFPLLASGNNGYALDFAFQIAKESIASFEGVNLKKVTLVIYGDHIAAIVKEQGYAVAEIPEDLQKAALKKEHQEKQKKLLADGKEAAQKVLEDQIAKAIEWIKKPENQKKVYDAGTLVFQLVTKKKIPKR